MQGKTSLEEAPPVEEKKKETPGRAAEQREKKGK
jgi:hypothetical protein